MLALSLQKALLFVSHLSQPGNASISWFVGLISNGGVSGEQRSTVSSLEACLLQAEPPRRGNWSKVLLKYFI